MVIYANVLGFWCQFIEMFWLFSFNRFSLDSFFRLRFLKQLAICCYSKLTLLSFRINKDLIPYDVIVLII